MRKTLVLSGLLPVLAGACQPLPPDLPAFPPGPATAAPATPLPSRWWSLYQTPALDALVRQALAHNQDLAQAEAHLRGLTALYAQQQAAQGVQTDLGLAQQYGKSADDQTLAQARGGVAASQWQTTPSVALSWQPDLFGQLRAALGAAQAQREAGAAARDQLRLVVAAQTTLAWQDLCSYTAQQQAQQAALSSLQASTALARRQRAGGIATPLDVERLVAQAQQSAAQLPWLAGQQRQAASRLALLTGQPPSVPAAFTCTQLAHLPQRLPRGDAWTLLTRRPDLRQAQRTLLAARWTVEQVRAQLYPQVTFGLNWTASAHTLPGLGRAEAVSVGVGPLLSWQFPNRAANQARLAAANAQRDASAAAWQQAVLVALDDVRQALAGYEGERRRQVGLAQAQAAAEHASDIAEQTYRAGALDGLARLQAQRDALQARQLNLQAQQRQAHAEVALFQALGGGWSEGVLP